MVFPTAVVALMLALPAQAQVLPSAAQVLEESAAAHRQMRTFAVSYDYTVFGGETPHTQAGQAWFSWNRYRIVYDTVEYYADGTYVYVYHPAVERVFVHDVDKHKYWDIDRLFLYDWTDTRPTDLTVDSGAWRVTVALDGGDLFKAELWVDKESHLIQRAILYDTSGRRHSYELEPYEPRGHIPGRVFRWSVRRHPNTELLPMTAEPYEVY